MCNNEESLIIVLFSNTLKLLCSVLKFLSQH